MQNYPILCLTNSKSKIFILLRTLASKWHTVLSFYFFFGFTIVRLFWKCVHKNNLLVHCNHIIQHNVWQIFQLYISNLTFFIQFTEYIYANSNRNYLPIIFLLTVCKLSCQIKLLKSIFNGRDQLFTRREWRLFLAWKRFLLWFSAVTVSAVNMIYLGYSDTFL